MLAIQKASCLPALFCVLLFRAGGSTAQQLPGTQAKTLERFRQFVAVEERFRDFPAAADRHAWFACNRLSRQIRDSELPMFEAFAVSDEAKDVRWLFAGILIQRNQFNSAAHVIVYALTESNADRQYGMWKWWEYNFKERADFQEMNLKIAEGFVHQYEIGTASDRLTIAEIFGKGPPEARMSTADFRRAIGLPDQKVLTAR